MLLKSKNQVSYIREKHLLRISAMDTLWILHKKLIQSNKLMQRIIFAVSVLNCLSLLCFFQNVNSVSTFLCWSSCSVCADFTSINKDLNINVIWLRYIGVILFFNLLTYSKREEKHCYQGDWGFFGIFLYFVM